MSSNKANQGGSSNRQGPNVSKGSKGPIIGKMSSLSGSTKPWDPSKGTNKRILKGSKKPGGR